ncbi:phage tail fiber repeat family protein [Glutamicibacter sp. X7]
MQGSLNLSGRPAKVRLRVRVRDLPAGASVRVTDLMLQPGAATSGWLPHTTELPWAAGMTSDNTGGSTPVYWDEILGKPSLFPPTSHQHSIGDVSGLQAALDGKASASHTHAIGQVTGLQSALDGKSNTGHTHAVGDVNGLQTALDGKSNTSHTHAVATQSAAGFMSAADKTKLDKTDLGYRQKAGTDAPSTYPGGVSVGLVSRSDGWPAATSFWTLVNFGSSTFVAAKVQHLYPYNDPTIAPLYRMAQTDDTWSAFEPLRGA